MTKKKDRLDKNKGINIIYEDDNESIQTSSQSENGI